MFGVKTILRAALGIINTLVLIGLLATGYSYLVDPAILRYAAPLGLLFPAFLAANGVCVVLTLLIAWRQVWQPLVAFALCYTPLTMYYTFRSLPAAPDDALTIMTYNVHDFSGTETRKENIASNIVATLLHYDADIVCLQECNEKRLTDSLSLILTSHYPYHHYCEQGKDRTSLALYSKFPLQKVDSIPCDTLAVVSVAYTLALPQGTVRVVNNHFESNKFAPDKKKDWREMMHGELQKEAAQEESRYIFAQFTQMALQRNTQMKAVADNIALYSDVPTIVCGDFNETPISYNYHLLANNNVDAFRYAGHGSGWTYCNHAMRVRIDHTLCSPHLIPHRCEVLTAERYSDHYPLLTHFSLPTPAPNP